MSDVKATLDRALRELRGHGAQGDVWLEQRRTLSLSVREGRLDNLQRAEVRGLAVRAMVEGRLGFVHTGRADEEGAAEAVARACELARAGSPRDDLALAPVAGPTDGRDEGEALGRCDDRLTTQPMAEKIEWLQETEAAARRSDSRIRRGDGASWNEGIGGHWLASTAGLYRHYRSSGLSVAVSVVAEEAGELQSGDRSWEGIRLTDLPEPDAFGQEAGDRAVRLLGGTPVPTGRFPVVFSPDAGFALLIYLAVALNGDHLSRRRSWIAALQDDPEALQLASPLCTIRDDGRHPAGPNSRPFDGEGVDTRNRILIDRGRQVDGLFDLASARRMGRESSGNARRDGYEGLPQIGAHNLYLEPGAATREEILSSVDRGLWLWGLSGWWIGLDPSNDRFSSAAFGLWLENGHPVRPVARVSIAGPIREILSSIDLVGNDLVWDHATKTPTFRVREMVVAGT